MTATLDSVPEEKDKPEPSLEQRVAEELVAAATMCTPTRMLSTCQAGDLPVRRPAVLRQRQEVP